ncbi:hypothetical protein ACLOJK_003038 [Asimina triloba]
MVVKTEESEDTQKDIALLFRCRSPLRIVLLNLGGFRCMASVKNKTKEFPGNWNDEPVLSFPVWTLSLLSCANLAKRNPLLAHARGSALNAPQLCCAELTMAGSNLSYKDSSSFSSHATGAFCDFKDSSSGAF